MAALDPPPMILERGDPNIDLVDKGVVDSHKRWKDHWFDRCDVNGVKLSDYGRKVNQAGVIYCEPCDKYLKYYTSGIYDILTRHASKRSHYDKYSKWKFKKTLLEHGPEIAAQEKAELEQKRAALCKENR